MASKKKLRARINRCYKAAVEVRGQLADERGKVRRLTHDNETLTRVLDRTTRERDALRLVASGANQLRAALEQLTSLPDEPTAPDLTGRFDDDAGFRYVEPEPVLRVYRYTPASEAEHTFTLGADAIAGTMLVMDPATGKLIPSQQLRELGRQPTPQRWRLGFDGKAGDHLVWDLTHGYVYPNTPEAHAWRSVHHADEYSFPQSYVIGADPDTTLSPGG